MFRFLIRVVLAAVVILALAIAGYRMAASQRENQFVADLLTPESVLTETPHGRIHSLMVGPEDGPTVLLVHGSIGWAGLWKDTMDVLAGLGYRAIAIDLPPKGLSERTLKTDYSRQAQALRILAFVEKEEIAPVIVAHSVGAGAALEAIFADQDAFEGAVIVDGALFLGQDGSNHALPAWLRPTGLREALVASTVTSPHLNRWFLGQFVHQKDAITDAHVATIEYPLVRKDTTETLARLLPTLFIPPRGAISSDPAAYASLTLPVALIWGREDSVTPPDQAVALQSALGQAPLYWLDDVGHIPHIEAPDVFHDTLAKALAGLADPT